MLSTLSGAGACGGSVAGGRLRYRLSAAGGLAGKAADPAIGHGSCRFCFALSSHGQVSMNHGRW